MQIFIIFADFNQLWIKARGWIRLTKNISVNMKIKK